MNKNVIKIATIALTCTALCATTLAAPAPRGGKMPAAPRQHQKAPAPKPPEKHGPKAPKHHEPQVAHHPAPAHHNRPHTPPPPAHRKTIHVEHHHEANGWAVLGAAVIGGIIGAIAH